MKRIASSFAVLPATARGAIWMCLACASFATMALTIRLLATDIPPLEIGFFRAFFSFLLMVPFALRTGPSIWNSKNHKVYMVRGMTGAGFVMCFFPGVALMEIADAQALTFTTPLFGMMLAMMFLGERFHVNRVFALLAGFAGALIIIRPGFQEISIGAVLVLCSALFASGSGALMKFATRSDAPDKVVFFHAIYMTPLILIGALFDWQWPNLYELGMLVCHRRARDAQSAVPWTCFCGNGCNGSLPVYFYASAIRCSTWLCCISGSARPMGLAWGCRHLRCRPVSGKVRYRGRQTGFIISRSCEE